MARYAYTGISAGVQEEITPQWPCTLMIYDEQGDTRVYIEVKRGDDTFERFGALRFYDGQHITPVDLPGCSVRVAVEGAGTVSVEVLDGAA